MLHKGNGRAGCPREKPLGKILGEAGVGSTEEKRERD